MKKRSKRYKLIEKKKVRDKLSFDKSLDLVKETCTTKMDESIDLSIRINTKQSKGGDFNLRTVVKLPNGNGKKFKIAVLCEQEKVQEAIKVGADISGSQDLLDKISSGELNFDKLICTPGMMSKIGKLGKILGPKGLMPNPKSGTVTDDIVEGINLVKAGRVEFKMDKTANVAVIVGKRSFTPEQITENTVAAVNALNEQRPKTSVGRYIKSLTLSSTMSPGLAVDVADFNKA